MHTYRNAFPLPSGPALPGILDSLRMAVAPVARHLHRPRNPVVGIAEEMDRLTEAMTDDERRASGPDAIARRLRSHAYRAAVAGLVGGFGKVGSGG
ncbi:MAG: hypothetical protein R8L07_15655 [Alphaproteobacteria bacterium]|nr:hypothetical protein [Alphaproteobacteria bacterium]